MRKGWYGHTYSYTCADLGHSKPDTLERLWSIKMHKVPLNSQRQGRQGSQATKCTVTSSPSWGRRLNAGAGWMMVLIKLPFPRISTSSPVPDISMAINSSSSSTKSATSLSTELSTARTGHWTPAKRSNANLGRLPEAVNAAAPLSAALCPSGPSPSTATQIIMIGWSQHLTTQVCTGRTWHVIYVEGWLAQRMLVWYGLEIGHLCLLWT